MANIGGIFYTSANTAPLITSGGTGTVAENAATNTVVYTAVATDAVGTVLTYSLTGADASFFNINSSTGVVTLKASANFEAKSFYSFNVVARDNATTPLSATKAVVLTVVNQDEVAPTFTSSITASAVGENSGAGQVVYTATSTDTVDTSTGSTTYSLKAATGDVAAFSINSSTGEVTLTGNPNYELKSSYSFTVVATDAANNVREQGVTLAVTNVNEAPVITSGATGTVAENAPINTVVYTAAATDVDAGTVLTYSLSGTDSAAFSIDSGTGAVTLNTSANYEAKASYSIDVVATDNGTGNLTATQAVTINVTNVNEAPVITSGATGTVAENAPINTVVYTAAATDVDAGTVLTYSLSGTDSAAFSIDSGTGAVTLNTSANYEAKASYSIDVVATDNGTGNLTATQAVTINVTNVNEAPTSIAVQGVIAAQDETAVSDGNTVMTLTTADPENDVVTYSLVDDAGGAFEIVGDQVLVLDGSQLDYETQTSVTIIVRATDTGGLFTDQEFTINLNNINDNAPVLNASVVSIDENSAASTPVATLAATDADGALNTLVYSAAGTGTGFGLFDVAADGSITVANGAVLDYETTQSYTLDIEVTDGLHVTPATVTINLNNLNDNTPVITAPIWSFSDPVVAENTTSAGTVTATDADGALNTLTYSLVDGFGDNALFTLNATTGALSFTNAPNYEAPFTNTGNNDNIYDVEVQVSDGVNTGVSQFWVTVTNVNEAPVITSIATANYAENGISAAYTIVAADPEGTAPLTYSISGDDAHLFSVDMNGVVTFNSSPNFEAPADANFDNVYDITVVASDGLLSNSQAVAITVANVNEAPVIVSGAMVGMDENQTFVTQVTAADVDVPDSVTFAITGGLDASLFAIDANTGILSFNNAPNFEQPLDDGGINVYDVQVTATDAGSLADVQNLEITVADVNDAPVVTANTLANALEYSTTAILQANLAATDEDGDALIYTLTSQPSLGELYNGTTLMVVGNTFTAADIANGNIKYANTGRGTTALSGSDSFGISVSDGIATTNSTLDITVYRDNAAPVLDLNGVAVLGINGAAVAYTENAAATLLAPVVSLTDSDTTNLNGGYVLVQISANAEASDTLSVSNLGSSGTITIVGDAVSYNGTLIGHVDATLNGVGTDLKINLDSDAPSLTAVRHLVQSIQYSTSETTGVAKTVEFYVNDGEGAVAKDSAITTVALTTTAVNDAPVGVNDTGVAAEAGGVANGTAGSDATGNVLSNDTDVDSANLQVTAVHVGGTEGAGAAGTVGVALAGTYGSLTLNSDGSYTYVVDNNNATVQALAVNATLSESFNYSVSDGNSTDTAVLAITINGANDAPVAVANNALTVSADATSVDLTSLLLANDSDIDAGSTFQITSVANVVSGYDVSPTGYTYSVAVSPLQSLIGLTSIPSFTTTLWESWSNSVDVVAKVWTGHMSAGNFVKDTLVDTSQIITTPANSTASYTFNFANASNLNAQQLYGLELSQVGGAGQAIILQHIGNDAYTGGDAFVWGTPTNMDLFGSIPSISASLGDLAVDANGVVSYTPPASAQALGVGETLTDQFTYTITDDQGATSTANMSITVNGVNDAPVAVSSSGVLTEGGVDAVWNLATQFASDADTTDTLSVTGITYTVDGVATGNGGTDLPSGVTLVGNVLTTAPANVAFDHLANGQSTVIASTFTVSDGNGGTSTATLTQTIQGVNDAPVAAADNNLTVSADATSVDLTSLLLVNDSDVDTGSSFHITSVANIASAGYSAAPSVARAYLLDNPFETFTGLTSIPSFTAQLAQWNNIGTADVVAKVYLAHMNGNTLVKDQLIDTSETLTVPSGNQGIALPYTFHFTQASALNSQMLYVVELNQVASTGGSAVAFADTSNPYAGGEFGFLYGMGPGEDLAGSIPSSSASFGNLAVDVNGTVTYTPPASAQALRAGETLTDQFTYTITDDQGATSTATMTITVNGVNDAPVNSVPDTSTPGSEIYVEGNNPVAFDGSLGNPSAISITDADNATDNIQVTLTATNGVFGVTNAGATGLVVLNVGAALVVGQLATAGTIEVTGTGTTLDPLVITGSQADINDVLATLTFNPNPGYSGNATISVTSNDGLAQSNSTVNLVVGTTSDEYILDAGLSNSSNLFVNDPTMLSASASNTIYDFANADGLGAHDYDVLSITGASAASATVSNGFNTTISFAGGASVTLDSLTSSLDGSRVTFADGSLLKINHGAAGLLTGGALNDQLVASNNGDTLRGFAGNDKLVGGNGNDWLYGGSGDDTLDGGNGHNVFIGGLGSDTITTGSGEDWISYSGRSGGIAGGDDTVNGFAVGQDKIQLTGYATVTAAMVDSGNLFLVNDDTVNTTLTLIDGSNILLLGVTGHTFVASDFVGYNG